MPGTSRQPIFNRCEVLLYAAKQDKLLPDVRETVCAQTHAVASLVQPGSKSAVHLARCVLHLPALWGTDQLQCGLLKQRDAGAVVIVALVVPVTVSVPVCVVSVTVRVVSVPVRVVSVTARVVSVSVGAVVDEAIVVEVSAAGPVQTTTLPPPPNVTILEPSPAMEIRSISCEKANCEKPVSSDQVSPPSVLFQTANR